MRAISFSACFISSMARFSMASCSFSYCQLAHISEWTMYWLMAVSSSARNAFKHGDDLVVAFHFGALLGQIIIGGWCPASQVMNVCRPA